MEEKNIYEEYDKPIENNPEVTNEMHVNNYKQLLLTPIVYSELLTNWDTAVVDLYRNGGMFVAKNVRLRNCSLHYNNVCNEYYVTYKSVTFGVYDIYNQR